MSAEFDIGTIVVCINDSWVQDKRYGEKMPYKGQVLTIRSIEIRDDDTPFLRFEEIVNPVVEYPNGLGECRFCAFQFRPVRKTDISVFEKHLIPVKDEVMA
jgi:hypothetical protein